MLPPLHILGPSRLIVLKEYADALAVMDSPNRLS